ncbi:MULTISPECIES: hypothetical protein [unclassified Janthinobacterium]|uniref:hypothetical protein n=1 Tax=unclassified Janthinobacterium TaxID=2610881 RepID=UPI0025AF2285|nr:MULTISPECIES: hypothetical protein [unclassified Janthinobacterium]MDN2715809.1 hypothetical protein [Janthinobacterium sp. SUN120]MDO8048361.1 hypothetical protein [Janthinobacterium sp. SUN211]
MISSLCINAKTQSAYLGAIANGQLRIQFALPNVTAMRIFTTGKCTIQARHIAMRMKCHIPFHIIIGAVEKEVEKQIDIT